MKVVYCKISSWKGQVPLAEHYYVNLDQRVYPRQTTHSLLHPLTLSEAALEYFGEFAWVNPIEE